MYVRIYIYTYIYIYTFIWSIIYVAGKYEIEIQSACDHNVSLKMDRMIEIGKNNIRDHLLIAQHTDTYIHNYV